ncbi:hypothetical protein IHQ68_00375 [Chelatococcus sambhunathii]|uniref:Uracil DNA glycosylase superfamily n=1 Tax=Chelatococcus sambhunathii TaxID=363953 RepID=A0ABU1DAD6_9HYPH|nr:hypothetical protein [Chelatococcus sambhunathii]MDR4305082.1 hypothetical protein [Chelatococcus sambhunathii]
MKIEEFARLTQCEHDRLGYRLGWRILTCPTRNMDTARLMLIALNPGGSYPEAPKISVEDGNAYERESWKGQPPGTQQLQKQVIRMIDLCGQRPADILSGYFVPFRSPGWNDSDQKKEAIRHSRPFWSSLLSASPAELIISFGHQVAKKLENVDYKNPLTVRSAGWGTMEIRAFQLGRSKKLISLPHLSRFGLFNRARSEAAFCEALQACGWPS